MLCATAIQTLAVHLPKLLRVSAQTRCVELPFLGVCTGERQRPSSTDHQALEGNAWGEPTSEYDGAECA